MTQNNGSIKGLVESMSKFSYAMTLFGINRMADAFLPNFGVEDEDRETKMSHSFDSVALAVKGNIDEPLSTFFVAGDRLQGLMTDFFYNCLTLDLFNSRNTTKGIFEFLLQSTEIARAVMGGNENNLFLKEFGNKLQAYSFFEYVDELLPPNSERSLNRMIERTASIEPFASIWAMEGIGYFYTEKISAVTDLPDHLLISEVSYDLPEKSLIPLHAGMGLSLARNFLERIRPETSFEKIVDLTGRYISLCRNNSRAGYSKIVFETLGLVCRNLYPHLILTVDRALENFDEDYTAYFWHGAGRAMYFSPCGILPVFDERRSSILATQDEPPHERGKLNALAGWLFAMTLVNIRQPEIIADCFKNHRRLFASDGIVADGIGSAMIVWHISAQESSLIKSFLNYTPVGENEEFVSQWREIVSEPVARTLSDYLNNNKNERQPDRLFRCRRRNRRQTG